MAAIEECRVTDPVLCELLSSDKLANAIISDAASPASKLLIAFNAPIPEQPVESEPIGAA